MRRGLETPALPGSMRATGASEIPLPQPAWLEDGAACRTRDTPHEYPPWQDLSQPLRNQQVAGRVRVLSERLRFASFGRGGLYQCSKRRVYAVANPLVGQIRTLRSSLN